MFRIENRYQDSGWHESSNHDYVDLHKALIRAAAMAENGIFWGMTRVVDTRSNSVLATYGAGISTQESAKITGAALTAYKAPGTPITRSDDYAARQPEHESKRVRLDVSAFISDICRSTPNLNSVAVVLDWTDNTEFPLADMLGSWGDKNGILLNRHPSLQTITNAKHQLYRMMMVLCDYEDRLYGATDEQQETKATASPEDKTGSTGTGCAVDGGGAGCAGNAGEAGEESAQGPVKNAYRRSHHARHSVQTFSVEHD